MKIHMTIKVAHRQKGQHINGPGPAIIIFTCIVTDIESYNDNVFTFSKCT